MKIKDYIIEPYADLCGASLCRANLRGASLHGASLHGADLHGADLHGADLCGAGLRDADLCGADLRDANLRGASLHGASLHGADLHGAALCGADLRDANLFNLRHALVLPVDDPRGYRAIAVAHGDHWRIFAGCQAFTIDEARAHWSAPDYHGPEHQAARYLMALDWLERFFPTPENAR